MSQRKETMWRCDCGDAHFLTISRDEGWDDYILVEGAFYPHGMWERIKCAWAVLTGQDHYSSMDIVLTDQVASEIAAELTKIKGAPFESQGGR